MKYKKLISFIEKDIIKKVYHDGNFVVEVKENSGKLYVSVFRDGKAKLENVRVDIQNDTTYFTDSANKITNDLLLHEIDNLIEELDSLK